MPKFKCSICLIEIYQIRAKDEYVYVANGRIVEEDPKRNKFKKGDIVRTSVILNVDFQKKVIETLNTFYHF